MGAVPARGSGMQSEFLCPVHVKIRLMQACRRSSMDFIPVATLGLRTVAAADLARLFGNRVAEKECSE